MTRRFPATTALALAVVASTAAGCGTAGHTSAAVHTNTAASKTDATSRGPTATANSSTTTSTSTTTIAGSGSVDRSNPAAVAAAAITANWTSNTATDHGPFDATVRSLTWYSAAGAAKVRAHPPTGPPGATWDTWAAHQATTTVAVQANHDPGAPADTATVAYRQFNVVVTPHGEDSWTSTPETYQCFVTLTRTSTTGPWQVASFEVAK